MSIIEEFTILNLFEEKNVKLFFHDKTTVFVGENGIGKTTVLAIFYYTITSQLEMLEKYDFDSIVIKYKNENEIKIKHEDITRYNDLKKRKLRSPERYSKDIKRQISNEQLIKVSNQTINSKELNELFSLVYQSTGMPRRLFEMGIDFIQETSSEGRPLNENIHKLIELNEKKFREYKILYFPTYRRIEEDVSNLRTASNTSKRINEELLEDFSNAEQTGELIQFGMDDVKHRIEKLLNVIKNNSIDSFNTMTSKLLNQYLEGNLENSSLITSTSKGIIEIALHRVGTKISEQTRKKILSMYDDGSLISDQYLANLVMNIVENYNNLKSIDERIENFVNKSNTYLYNKRMIYDPSEISLKIVHNSIPDKFIALEKLSSGEKQLISTFSKVFLEDSKKLIILFDEPELSLSLDWQKNFIYDLSNSSNCKFLIAVTHSPFIFDKLLKETYELEDFIVEVGNVNGRY